MNWTKLNFGKHAGKTLPQVLFNDPDWFFWAWEEGAFEGRGILRMEAKTIRARAKSIKIPSRDGERQVVIYKINEGKFFGFDVVKESTPAHQGTTVTQRSNHLDMEFPRTIKNYDKLGCQLLTNQLKHLILSSVGKKRMTKQLCEEFFSKPDHFYETE